METTEPNSHSQSLSSHFSPENYKWLAENIESVAQIAKKVKKIMEEDENTSSNKKPEVIAQVDELTDMHQLLSQKYHRLLGDLLKNFSSVLQLQVSDSAPHQASDCVALMNKPPAPSINIGDKLAEIQFVGTEEYKKQIMECQEKIRVSNEKLHLAEEEISMLKAEVHEGVLRKVEYEEELRISSEKLQLSEVEISRLTSELENVVFVSSQVEHLQTELDLAHCDLKLRNKKLEMEKKRVEERQNRIADLERQNLNLVWKMDELKEELPELVSKNSEGRTDQLEMQSQLEGAQRDLALLEASIDLEKEKLLDVQQKLLNNFDIIESSRKSQEKTFYEKEKLEVRNWKLETQLKNEIEQRKAEKLEMQSSHETQENCWRVEFEKLKLELSEKRELLENSNKNLDALKLMYGSMMEEKDTAYAEMATLKEELGHRASKIKEMEDNIRLLDLQHTEVTNVLESEKKITGELRSRVEELEEKGSEATRQKGHKWQAMFCLGKKN